MIIWLLYNIIIIYIVTICTVFTIRTVFTICIVCALFIYRVAFCCNLFIGLAFYRNLLSSAAILLQNVSAVNRNNETKKKFPDGIYLVFFYTYGVLLKDYLGNLEPR